MEPSVHRAVLVEESMFALDIKSDGLYLDATLGGATHTEEILRRSAPDGRVLSLDLDPRALERAKQKLASYGDRWLGVEANFRRLALVAKERGFSPVDGILLDLGVSSDELADRAKGFSFQVNGPLDMRLGPQANEDGLTAAEIVNSWPEEKLADVIYQYGEERLARRIAAAIVKARQASRIIGTLDLVAVIKQAVPKSYEHGRIHPATRTFQALRLAVNDELGALRDALAQATQILKPNGRLAVISFHSLEDRVVKHFFRESAELEVLTKRPIIPKEEEIAINPRARSAKLRIASKK